MKNHIPKAKGDVEAVGYLKTLSFETLRSDVPELLIWFQDLNWGLSDGIAAFLIPHVNEIKNELITILNGSDGEWKRGVLIAFVAKTLIKLDPELLSVIKRIAELPNKNEKDEGVDIIAKKIIAKDKCQN